MAPFGMSSTIRAGSYVHVCCSGCGKKALTSFRGFRYLHLFHLPLLPMGSAYGVACSHCDDRRHGRELDAVSGHRARSNSRDLSRPHWHFLGLGLALLALMLCI
ncbi:MAG: hypothetical protein PVF57_11290 [Pseudomonadales bacterium]|jgi:hypothetical protein